MAGAGYSLETASTATSGAKSDTKSAFDSSNWSVNFGAGSIANNQTPSWVVLAALAGAAVWMLRRK